MYVNAAHMLQHKTVSFLHVCFSLYLYFFSLKEMQMNEILKTLKSIVSDMVDQRETTVSL